MRRQSAHALRCKGPNKDVVRRLGHTSIRSTMRYRHLVQDSAPRTVGAWSGWPPPRRSRQPRTNRPERSGNPNGLKIADSNRRDGMGVAVGEGSYSQVCAQVCWYPQLRASARGGAVPGAAADRCGGRGSTSPGVRSRNAANSDFARLLREPAEESSSSSSPFPPRPRGRGGRRLRRRRVQTICIAMLLWTVGARPSDAAPTG